jgi:hypothetical protein
MPSHKKLKSVVRSVADQFTSLMNYVGDDYVMGHLLSAARATGERALHVDLLTGKATPPELLLPEIARSVAGYAADFADLVRRSGSEITFVTEANMRVTFDLATRRPAQIFPRSEESPYICVVTILDDRSRLYSAEVHGWWFPENMKFRPLKWRIRIALRRLLRLNRGAA